VTHDFPQAAEVLVSFPDRWEYLETTRSPEHQLYIAGFPIERAHTSRDHFAGLSPEINVSLVFYRRYKFFQPRQMPTVFVNWDEQTRSGTVAGFGETNLQLQPVGQAQAWFGIDHALIWECYFDESQRHGDWQERLSAVWKIIEKDVGTENLWTAPHEPAFPEGYREFLSRLGYAPDIEHPFWWSKLTEQERLSIMPK
jgi:hypothetical protein